MSPAPRIGILGGTFDPIHLGHLEAASAAQRARSLDRVLLLPARTPPHRSAEPRASAFHRFAMTALAVNGRDDMVASDIELRRDGPSYTALTLEALHREGFPAASLYFIVGRDAFAEIGSWHDYPRILELANFVVVSRPGLIPNPQHLAPSPQSPVPSASTTAVFHVDAETPDVSSTDIRRRISAGESIAGLVPPTVAEHIKQHQLYL